jgi:hypothetical protein
MVVCLMHQQLTSTVQEKKHVEADGNNVTWLNVGVPSTLSVQIGPLSCHSVPSCQGMSASRN